MNIFHEYIYRKNIYIYTVYTQYISSAVVMVPWFLFVDLWFYPKQHSFIPQSVLNDKGYAAERFAFTEN